VRPFGRHSCGKSSAICDFATMGPTQRRVPREIVRPVPGETTPSLLAHRAMQFRNDSVAPRDAFVFQFLWPEPDEAWQFLMPIVGGWLLCSKRGQRWGWPV
jgi:hypothetical protein